MLATLALAALALPQDKVDFPKIAWHVRGAMGTPTVTGKFFANLPYEEAIQPCVTYGNPAGQYFVSHVNATTARIRRSSAR